MEKLKNIVFDFGGVLIDWSPLYLYRNVFDRETELNFFLENVCRYDWNLLQDGGRPLAEATLLLQQKFPEYINEIAMYYDRWEEMLGGTIDENTKLIKPLKEKYSLYGLTNWSAETLPLAMKRYDFFQDLKGIVVSGEEKIVKPDKRLYHILLNRYNLRAEESLFIDDNTANIETARDLGFQTVHLANGINLENWLQENNIL